MQEKATETQKDEEKKSDLIAIDDLYYKIKAQQKLNRCKSANTKVNNNKRIININRKNLHNTILNKAKNNSIDLPFFTPHNSSLINKKTNTIDLTNLLDSKIFDSTKQSTKRFIFSGRANSSYNSIMSKTKIFENKKKIPTKKKSLSVIDINANTDNFYYIINKNKTLKDLDIEKLMKKSKMIDFNKVKDNQDNENNIQRAKVYDLMPALLIYMKQKENNKERSIIKKNNNIRLNLKKKKRNIINKSNYSVKYNFLDNVIDNIDHIVNFVDIDNREEIKQNVVIDYNSFPNSKSEDFKTYGFEFDPGIITKNYQDEKQKLIKQKYKELKKQILNENLQNVAFLKMMSPKRTKNYIPEYKRISKEMLNQRKKYIIKNNNKLDKSTSTKELIKKITKEKEKNQKENNIVINEFLSNKSKKMLNKDLESIKQEKIENIKNNTLLNLNSIKKKKKSNKDINNFELDKKINNKKEKKN